MAIDITWWVYEPIDNEKRMGYRVANDKCRAQVPTYSVSFGQCSRNPKVTIEGYGFCTQHGKQVQAWIDRRSPAKGTMMEDKPKTYYIANCIQRAILAGAADGHLRQFSEDLADAIALADSKGIAVAHDALKALCAKAEKGEYGTDTSASTAPA